MIEDINHLSCDVVGDALTNALNRLVVRDAHLLAEDVNERSVTHHLAIYLADAFPGWNVDVEYNRNVGEIKRLHGLANAEVDADDTTGVTVYPDIIVHRRGTHQNLLVVEVKRAGRGDHVWDHKKLQAFTSSRDQGGLGYRWGVHAVLGTDGTAEVRWFSEGSGIG